MSRFWLGDASTPGSVLGLAIAIAKAGTIDLSDAPGHGLTVSVMLPANAWRTRERSVSLVGPAELRWPQKRRHRGTHHRPSHHRPRLGVQSRRPPKCAARQTPLRTPTPSASSGPTFTTRVGGCRRTTAPSPATSASASGTRLADRDVPVRHRGVHRSARIGWLRAAVLGANDGIVSTASLIVGVAATGASRSAVIMPPPRVWSRARCRSLPASTCR